MFTQKALAWVFRETLTIGSINIIGWSDNLGFIDRGLSNFCVELWSEIGQVPHGLSFSFACGGLY